MIRPLQRGIGVFSLHFFVLVKHMLEKGAAGDADVGEDSEGKDDGCGEVEVEAEAIAEVGDDEGEDDVEDEAADEDDGVVLIARDLGADCAKERIKDANEHNGGVLGVADRNRVVDAESDEEAEEDAEECPNHGSIIDIFAAHANSVIFFV